MSEHTPSAPMLPPSDDEMVRLMALPPKERMEAIIDRPDAATIVHRMTPQDFYLTVMEIGADDAVPLLQLATTEQWIHLFDMACWSKDRVIAGNAVEWLERLTRATSETLLPWLYKEDFSFLVVLVKRWLRVALKPDDIDLTEAYDFLPPHTIDNQYFWECRYPQYTWLMEHLLSVLFQTNYAFYRELMEYAMYTLEAEMEEEAYRLRKGRLEDQAVPDYYDALTLYAPLSPSELSFEKHRALGTGLPVVPSRFAIARLTMEDDLFTKAMGRITDHAVVDYLRLELASVANKVLVADNISPDDTESLREAMDKVSAMVNLGLSLCAGDNIETAAHILCEAFLEHLFRIGYTAVEKLRRRAQRLVAHGWIAGCPSKAEILGDEWHDTFTLLTKRPPKILRCAASPGILPREDFFRHLEDLRSAREHLDTILCLGFLVERLAISWDNVADHLWRGGLFKTAREIAITQLLLTAVAHALTTGRATPSFALLDLAQWDTTFPQLHPARVEAFITTWLERELPRSRRHCANIRRALDRYIQPLVKTYREETLPFFERDEVPDPRFYGFFLFRSLTPIPHP